MVVIIRIYDASERNFQDNGLKILKPLLAEIYKEDNGDYYLDMESSINDIEWIVQGNIVTTNTPWGVQGFRLGNPEIANNVIKVRAKHLYFDSANYIIEDAYPQNQTAGGALNWVLARTDQSNPFTGSSDIGDVHSARYIRLSLEEVIASIVETYAGHLERDNFNISIKQNIGFDRGVTIAYSKNLTEFKAVENWDNVVTKLLPVGNDGLMLPEIYLLSDVQYDIPYTKTITFSASDGIDTEDEEAVIEDLRMQAQAYLDVNKYPQVNYTVNAHIDNVVDVGDTIQVIHNKSNTNLLTNVIAVKYNCILDKFSSIQFGNFRNNLKSLVKSINNQIETVKKDGEIKYSALELALQESQSTIMKYLTIGHKYITENAIYFLDTPDPATAQNFMIISLGGIGFGHNGIDNGYVTAWDITGKFNADFITTGTIRALNIESSNINNNNKFIVDALGNMTANNAVLNNGTFSGTITGGTLNINNRFIVDASGNMTATNANLSGSFATSGYGAGFLSKTQISDGYVTSHYLKIKPMNGTTQDFSDDTAGYTFIGAKQIGIYNNGSNELLISNGDIACKTLNATDYLKSTNYIQTDNMIANKFNGSSVLGTIITEFNRDSYTFPPETHTHSTLYYGVIPKVTIYENNFRPHSTAGDAALSCGSPSYRWTQVYAVTSTISTSDRDEKNSIEDLPYIYKELFKRLKPVRYKYNNGTSDRYHTGFISQDVEEIMDELGLDSKDFAGFIKTPRYSVMDAEGEYDTTSEIIGYMYGLRYEEFISPAISVIQEQAGKIESLENKLEALEQRLNKLEVA